MQKRLFLVLALLLLLCCLCVHLFAEEPSTVPAAEYGEGMTFSANTGRYTLKKALPSMPLTWEASVYFPYDATAKYDHILLSNYERSVSGYLWEVTRTGNPALVFYNSGGTTRYNFKSVNVYCGKKIHLAIVTDVEQGEIRCYADGVLAETQTLTVNPADYGVSYTGLGADHRELNLFLFHGALMRIACYADVRTAEEIAADVTAPSDDGLLLHYDTSATKYGETVVDLSKNKNNAVYEQFWYDEIDNITDYAYSIAVVGDTQHNVQYQPETFAKLYDWLSANAKDRKMAFMLGLGDITNDNTEEQWTHSIANIAKLDGVIPYALSCGNHDGTAESYSAQFAGTAYAAAVGDNYFGNLANSYQTFKAGDIHYAVITLEYNPTEEALAFAKSVAEAHPYHRVIVITHFNLNARGKLSSAGNKIWNNFVKDCPNVEMVFSGHVINDKILQNTTKGTAGNTVKHFMVNGQSVDGMRIYEDKEAAGLVAMLYFDASGKNVKFEYYSTSLDKYFMACNQFTATVGNLAGDADFSGKITVADTLKILKAYMNGAVCYNGDVNGDLRLTFTDVLATLRVATR